MLPGFRFLVAAVVLCLSMLVFGFGAAALLRSAREEFASLPVRRAAPQTAFTSQPWLETPATLSMMRIEAPEIPTAPAHMPVAVPQETPAPSAPEPVRQASLSLAAPAADLPATDSAPTPTEPVESIASVETVTAAIAAAPAPAEDGAEAPTTVAAIAPLAVPDQPVSTLTEADAQIVVTHVATLGGPVVDIAPVPMPKVKPVAQPAKKKARVKEKPAKRRRLASRAEVPAPAAPAPADAFGWQTPR